MCLLGLNETKELYTCWECTGCQLRTNSPFRNFRTRQKGFGGTITMAYLHLDMHNINN